jgi:hypothetical protein
MGVFDALITIGERGCAMFEDEGVLKGGEGVNDGKDEDEGEGECEVLIGWLFPDIKDSKSLKLLDSNAVRNSSRRLGVWF